MKKIFAFVLLMLLVSSAFAETEKRVDGKRVETYSKITATNMTVTNAIVGGVTGNAGTVTGLSFATGKTLTVNNIITLAAGGDSQTFTLPATSKTLMANDYSNASGNAPTAKNLAVGQHLRFTLIDPATAYGKSATLCIWNKTDAAIHVTNIEFRCNADPTTEVTGDIKYADSLIGLGTPTLIAAIDTTAGSFSSGAISVAVAAGKCIYLSYDTTPDAATTQHAADITFTYD